MCKYTPDSYVCWRFNWDKLKLNKLKKVVFRLWISVNKSVDNKFAIKQSNHVGAFYFILGN